jgi:hypothetical protein
VKNISAHTLAFKVKTTAPKDFLVRPNAAILAPGDSCSVSIKQRTIASEFSKPPKFLVQACPADGLDIMNAFVTNKDKIENAKVSCEFA